MVGGFCILTAASINVAIPSGNLTTRSTSTPPTAVQINRRSCRTLTVRKGHGQSRDVQFLQTLYSLTQQGRLLLFFDFDSSLDTGAPFIVIVALAWTPALLAILTIVALAWTTALHAILVRGRGLATYLDAVAGPCGPTSAFRIARGHLHATRSAFHYGVALIWIELAVWVGCRPCSCCGTIDLINRWQRSASSAQWAEPTNNYLSSYTQLRASLSFRGLCLLV